MTPRQLARFWAKVAKSADPDGCWLWTSELTIKGYGRFTPHGRRHLKAHRVAYELLVGPIPAGLITDHTCKVRHCVNPAHIEPVTVRENSLRGTHPNYVAHRNNTCAQGHPFTPENTLQY